VDRLRQKKVGKARQRQASAGQVGGLIKKNWISGVLDFELKG